MSPGEADPPANQTGSPGEPEDHTTHAARRPESSAPRTTRAPVKQILRRTRRRCGAHPSASRAVRRPGGQHDAHPLRTGSPAGPEGPCNTSPRRRGSPGEPRATRRRPFDRPESPTRPKTAQRAPLDEPDHPPARRPTQHAHPGPDPPHTRCRHGTRLSAVRRPAASRACLEEPRRLSRDPGNRCRTGDLARRQFDLADHPRPQQPPGPPPETRDRVLLGTGPSAGGHRAARSARSRPGQGPARSRRRRAWRRCPACP